MSIVCSAAVSLPEATAAFDSTAAVVSTVVSALVSAAEADVVSAVPGCPHAVDRAQTAASANVNCFNLCIKFFSPFKLSVQCLLSAFWLLQISQHHYIPVSEKGGRIIDRP